MTFLKMVWTEYALVKELYENIKEEVCNEEEKSYRRCRATKQEPTILTDVVILRIDPLK